MVGPTADDRRTVALPPVNGAVELRLETWPAAARTRVEDRRAGALDVARPRRAGGRPTVAAIGEDARLTWAAEDALYEVDGTVEAQADLPVPTLTIVVAGPPRRIQRRGAFRLEVALTCQLADARGDTGLARVLDLSESGMRCEPPEGLALGVGDEAAVALPLPEARVEAVAQVVRRSDDGRLGLHFVGIDERDADRIRGFLFAEQAVRRRLLAED